MGVKIRDLKGDGNWWLVIHHEGKRRQKKIGPDRREAERKAAEATAALRRRIRGLPEPLPMAGVLAQHLENHVRWLKHSTWVLQKGQIENHLIPAFQGMDARELEPAHVRDFVRAMREKYSVSFTRGCVNVLRKALAPVREKHPSIDDPTRGISRWLEQMETSEAHKTREVDAWPADQAAKLLAVTEQAEPRYYPVILFLLHTGCRRGEALGL